MKGRVEIDAVGDLIRSVAIREALSRWRKLAVSDIVEKAGPEDLVTVADQAVEAALERELVRFDPGSRVVGEEGVHAEPARLDWLREPGASWVIDPIDGTRAYASGEPGFAVMVALVIDQRLAGGWIHVPVDDVTVGALRGQGVRRAIGGRWEALRAPVPPVKLSELCGIVGQQRVSATQQSRIAASAGRFKSLEPAQSAGIRYVQLAEGRKHFALFGKSEPWDHLPGLAILAEHGFHAARHDGSPYRPGDNEGGLLLAPDQRLWAALRALLIEG